MAEDHFELCEQAYQAWEKQDYAAAGPLLIQAAQSAPDEATTRRLWFDAALAYKFLRDWPRALELGRTAASTAERGVGDPAFWNLGIAATALHEWEVARDAWTGFGIVLTSTSAEGEVREDFGMTPIRVDPDGRAEVVWAQRICPTRVIVRSVPMQTDRRFGDVILHDGAPNGYRVVGEHKYPVFDEIAVWQPSGIPTWTVVVDADAAGAADLVELFARHELGAEAATSMRPLCACCSTGEVEQQHTVAHPAEGQVYFLGAPEQAVFSLLHLWKSKDAAGRAYREVTLVLGDNGNGDDGNDGNDGAEQ